MAYSAFDDKTEQPLDEKVKAVLDESAPLWARLISETATRYDPLAEDWTYSGKKWGWALRLKHKKRAILYMTPREGHFMVGFAFGQKAVDAAHKTDLPIATLNLIDTSQKFAEGRAVRLEVKSAEEMDIVVRLAEIKMSN